MNFAPAEYGDPGCRTCYGCGWVFSDKNGRKLPPDLYDEDQGLLHPTAILAGQKVPIVEAPLEAVTSERCACAAKNISARVLATMLEQIPLDYRDKSIAHAYFQMMPREDVDPLRTYIKRLEPNLDGGKGYWFQGRSGNAKTTCAAAIAIEAGTRHRQFGFWRYARLLHRIRATCFGEGATMTEDEWIQKLGLVDLLILDDVGAEKATEWSVPTLVSILTAREDRCKPVIVTTNLTRTQMRDQVGDRIVSRLTKLCGVPHELIGPDYREMHAQARHRAETNAARSGSPVAS